MNVSSVLLVLSLTNWDPRLAPYVQKALFKTKRELLFVEVALLEDSPKNPALLHVILVLEVLPALLKRNLSARHVL